MENGEDERKDGNQVDYGKTTEMGITVLRKENWGNK